MNTVPESDMDTSQSKRRYRISDRLSGTLPSIFEGKLDRRFFPYFDYLLDSEHSPEEQSHFYDIYVRNPDLEEKLRKRIASPRSQITAITGARGVGKSTNIRFFFGASTQPKIRTLQKILPNKAPGDTAEYLIIPFYMDTHNISLDNVQRVLTSQIQSAAEFLAHEKNISFTDSDIYDFVHTHKSQLVTYADLPVDANADIRMAKFRECNTYGYATELLKYALHKANVEHVILIVDDIESCEYSVQKELVKGVLKLRDCLKNVGSLKRKYVPDYIFTCRPATFKLLKVDPEIDGFSVGYPIAIQRPASLSEIVQKRFDYAIKMIGEGRTVGNVGTLSDVKNLDSWKEAYRTFEIVLSRLTTIHEAMIVDLCNHDVRRALIDLQETLRNSRWYESRSHEAGAFTIDERDYNFASAGLLRALVLRENEYFSDELDSVVPNLFMNREAPEYDLMLLHVIKLFFEKARSQKVSTLKKSDIKSALRLCYPKEVVNNCFDDVINYARNTEILREERVPNGKRRTTSLVVPMNKAFALWKLCKTRSVFLEFFRDNTFLEHRLVANFPLSRTLGTSRLPAEQKFILCADFVCEIAESEHAILAYVSDSGRSKQYAKAFGNRLISRHIYWGLRNSIRRSYPKRDGRPTMPKDVARAISRAGSRISKVGL